MIIRAILPDYLKNKSLPDVIEADLSKDEYLELNERGYNIYFLPNYPKQYDPETKVDGMQIDTFEYVFVDMDLKEKDYADKDAFLAVIGEATNLEPSRIVDSGNGVHVYWRVSDLDALSFLRLQRRLCRLFKTDEAVSKIYQLMRLPGTNNTKDPSAPKECKELLSTDAEYTCEQLDALLPPISIADEAYCNRHYERTYRLADSTPIDDTLPAKFSKLMTTSQEAADIWAGKVEDRSASDYRLGHIMLAHGFTREEARSVLVNSAKALTRAPVHRISYADGIVDKIWTYEQDTELDLSESVRDILSRGDAALEGTRFKCYPWLDATESGFRLGQIIGLVAGVGVGKTAMALNMFMGFVQNNPDYVHFFVPLEQPANEIASRWKTMCGDNEFLYDKVQIMSNYDSKGGYRHLSLDDIKAYILKFQEKTKKKVGCVVIDHIGILKKKTENGENQGLIEICQAMKAFAVQTNTLLVMQSQAPREKAGIGDIELDKDAAYGTVFFEAFVDFLVTIWQPLKRVYSMENCPTVTAYKFCKIRHKQVHKDLITEDTPYLLYFDPSNLYMRRLTQAQETQVDYFAKAALNKRKHDKKSELTQYKSTTWVKKEEGAIDVHGNRKVV